MLPQRELVGKVECVGFREFKPVDGWFACDTETTGLDPWGSREVDRNSEPARPFAFSFCNADGDRAYVRWQLDPTTREVLVDPRTRILLQELFGNPELTAVMFNAPYDYRMIRMSGINIKCKIEDTLIGQAVINPGEFDNTLKGLAKRYLGIGNEDQKDLLKSTQAFRRRVQSAIRKHRKTGERVALWDYRLSDDGAGDYFFGDGDLCCKYAMEDAYRTAALYLAQKEHLDEDAKNGGKLWEVYRREHEVMLAVRAMEDRGTCIDMDKTEEIINFYNRWTAVAKFGINTSGGKKLNPRSPKQMTAHFFGKLHYTPLKYSTKKVGKEKRPVNCQHCKGQGCLICQDTGHNPKCDSDFLQHIGVKHELDEQGEDKIVPGDMLAYWMLYYKASGTMLNYVNQYRDLSVKDEKGNWILHPNFKQVEAVTGRFSCERPNLQNVASDDSGKKRVDLAYRSRECFVPRPGHLFYVPDYSQIEVWIFALLSQDRTMLDVLYKGGDFHGEIAKLIWGHEWKERIAKEAEYLKPHEMSDEQLKHLKIKKKWRKRAKNVKFTKLYGGGVGKIAETVGCSKEEAQAFVDQYDAKLPGVKLYMNKIIELAKRQGFVVNPYGRRYNIHRDLAYKAVNYMVQGTAAEVIKNAMIRLHRKCENRYKGQMFLLLQVHDELIIEVNKKIHSTSLMKEVVADMQADYKFLGSQVPFPVGMKITETNWSKTQDIKL